MGGGGGGGGGGQGGPNSQQAHDVVMTSMRRNDVASTRRNVPNRFLIIQCQIITFLILKYDIENSRRELRGIVLPVQVDALLGGPKGMLACPLKLLGGGGAWPPWPPLPTPMHTSDKFAIYPDRSTNVVDIAGRQYENRIAISHVARCPQFAQKQTICTAAARWPCSSEIQIRGSVEDVSMIIFFSYQ